jgi:DNA-binding NarL/FixJ family response regulator
MKLQPKVISISCIPGFRLDPTFTSEEAVILRALVAGKSEKQIRTSLHMPTNSFFRVIRDLWEKTGTTSNVSLVVWAQRRMKNCDQRLDRRERYERRRLA